MAQLSNTFEGGSNGTTITTGNSGGASGDAFNVVNIGAGSTVTFDNTHTAHGGLAMKQLMPAAAAQVTFVEWDPTATSDYYGRFYIYQSQLGTSDNWLYDGGNGGVDEAIILTNGTGNVQLLDSSLAVKATSTNVLSVNTWHRIEFHVICSTTVGQIEAKLFIGSNFDGNVADETVTTAANLNTGASNNQFLFGLISSGNNNFAAWFDDMICGAAAYPGTANPPSLSFPLPSAARVGYTN